MSNEEQKDMLNAAEECGCSCPAESACCESSEKPEETDGCCSCSSCESVEEQPVEESKAEPVSAKPERVRVEVTDAMIESSAKTLSVMLGHLKLEAEVKGEKTNSSAINLMVSSPDAGRIIGKKGQTLESLQFILNRMMQKDDQDFPRIFIDIDGYSTGSGKRDRRGSGDRRDRRGGASRRPSNGGGEDFDSDMGPNADVLRQQASDAAKEVRRWGESVTLPPMNARDRRIIHITLEGETDIATDSVGEGAKKRVVISMKKS